MLLEKLSQSSQNSKLAMFSQYPEKEVKDEVDFLHADKDQSFLKTLWASKLSTGLILTLLMCMIKHSQIT